MNEETRLSKTAEKNDGCLDPLLTKQKRSKVTGAKCKQVQLLYNKIVSLFQGITDLMPLGKFTDTIILAVSVDHRN